MPRGWCEMAEIAGHGKGTINDRPHRFVQEAGGCTHAAVLAEHEQG
jgi:hypothetical protein